MFALPDGPGFQILLPSQRATARMRILTPDFEMPFAGHPTLGTAHVVRMLADAAPAATCDALMLEMTAGVIAVATAPESAA